MSDGSVRPRPGRPGLAPHAFQADYRPSYREGPAKDGWEKMLAWFKRHGVA